jgi:phosphatidate phosphatase APP1
MLGDSQSIYGDRFAEYRVRTAGKMTIGKTQLLSKTGVSVVSDIDDTIKLSNVANKKALLANTLYYPFASVEGMAELYQAWEAQGAMFHYVSTTPWQLYNPVSSFLETSGFPEGSYHLKFFWWKDFSWLNLFASPESCKPKAIRSLLDQHPNRNFLLVGDVVEKDPEIYSSLLRQYPEQIAKVFLRAPDLPGTAVDRCRRVFDGIPQSSWQLFDSADEVTSDLESLLDQRGES